MPNRKQIANFVRMCRAELPESGLAYYGRVVHLMPDGRVLLDTKAYAEEAANGEIIRPVVSAQNIPERGAASVTDYLSGKDSGWWHA